MPPTKRTREISQESYVKSIGLIRVFMFLNNNINMWNENNYNACDEAKKRADVTWDAKITYNIVKTCIEAMNEYNETGNKPNTCDSIIWDNKRLNSLIRVFCNKIVKEEKQGTMKDRKNDGGIENILSRPFSIAEAKNLYNEKIKNVNFYADKGKEMIENGRKKQVDDITKIWSTLTKTFEDEYNKINKIFEELKKL
ncbi:uncharacterized protein OCT59_025949 [Rhizophagus irregularis]|uniref:Uncharacterized protein n=5 Tax=Rhizophagus irregularis TaxID=588596 RepID=A0A2I1EF06_9GLOM|nr:hypothetical protein GLOIN_2v1487921 [Rhizophagus irregularis DAOM 181602=DAOM 197198]EXX60731.1 hypothetical protein RirG_177190 [Rhizophagus irregularis DAOM 197198w]PKK78842.1 hypothetical protein RhiirC2_860981 [Rhizophagus irregularis]PKY20692.1 hypothetical protein RhiirB3_434070 [Rhizophagus irregularis]POG59322.1 hypothetical protein GLOIN_2v1487921 [Rhizophagus irregularis DAOM 181602=DAOM 197198]UZO05605.1 hypothetical protein OCT59_025949 [Rhizophagus irregularis]|eukprot:XP_025166188.1 hypothetical protein GLOIN_2v1487921 [Rhizophagus irregularis DAOM 181602=DAOM 197198]